MIERVINKVWVNKTETENSNNNTYFIGIKERAALFTAIFYFYYHLQEYRPKERGLQIQYNTMPTK